MRHKKAQSLRVVSALEKLTFEAKAFLGSGSV